LTPLRAVYVLPGILWRMSGRAARRLEMAPGGCLQSLGCCSTITIYERAYYFPERRHG
jgi:hypothetical protein